MTTEQRDRIKALERENRELRQGDRQAEIVVWNIRLPRVAAALLVGAALAAAGASYQALFRNPLVSPDILGVSGGAGLGAVAGIFLSLPVAAIQASAFVGGMAAVGFVTLVASLMQNTDRTLTLVLIGVVIGALAGAATSLLKVMADPYDELPAITFWLLGSLAAITTEDIRPALPMVLIGLVPLALLRWRINVLSLGDEEARALGTEAGQTRLLVIAAATLITTSVTALAGAVGLGRPRHPAYRADAARPRLRAAAAGLGGHRRTVFCLVSGARTARVVVMLEVRNLAIGYGATEIGRGLNLDAGGGEILCLLGPNGCGETTLFRTLLGLLPALSGTVLLSGTRITAQSRAEIARQIAYVPQAHAPPFPFEALEVVLMGRTARLGAFGQPGRQDRDIALSAMTRLGIADLAQRDYSRPSGGQRQLVLIARTLAQQAPLIVMDEPTASLDFRNQAQVLAQITSLARDEANDGRGVILSTHDPDQAFALDAQVLLLKDGPTQAHGCAKDVLTGAILSEVYGIPVSVEKTTSGRTICLPALGGQSAPTMTSDALTIA